MKNNKKNGTKFENDLCKKLSEHSMWARPMFPAHDGSQPFDVMAINKRGNLFAIECKDCVDDVFSLNRIEDNQRVSLTNLCYAYNMGNRVFFAFNTSKGIYFALAKTIIDLHINSLFGKSKKSLNMNEIEKISVSFEQFLKENGGEKI